MKTYEEQCIRALTEKSRRDLAGLALAGYKFRPSLRHPEWLVTPPAGGSARYYTSLLAAIDGTVFSIENRLKHQNILDSTYLSLMDRYRSDRSLPPDAAEIPRR